MSYFEYMQGESWRQKRLEAFVRHGTRCELCGSEENIQVHHATYRNLFNEDVETDLVVLCHDCHDNIHAGRSTKVHFKKKIDEDPFLGNMCSLCSEPTGSLGVEHISFNGRRLNVCYHCQCALPVKKKTLTYW